MHPAFASAIFVARILLVLGLTGFRLWLALSDLARSLAPRRLSLGRR